MVEISLNNCCRKPICDYIESQEGRCLNLCGETSLLSFAGIIAKAKRLITNDGGPLHMSVALGVKTVSIFGPVDEKVYGPYPASERHVTITKDKLPCRPCYNNFKFPECVNDNECLKGLDAKKVAKACLELLKK